LLNKNNIVLLEIAEEVVAQNAPCETPNQKSRGPCNGSSGNQECLWFREPCIGVLSGDNEECDNDCRRVGGWNGGSCKNEECVCDCWTSPP
jgi:hypothetical protein